MKKVLFFLVILCIPSVIQSQVLTQHFAKGEAVKNGVKLRKDGVSNGIVEMPPVDVEKLLKEDAEMAGEDVITGDDSSEHFFKGCNYKGSQGVRRKYSPTLKTDRALLWFNS